MRRAVVLVVPTFLLAGFIFYVTVLAPAAIANQPYPVPSEPIFFDHSIHTNLAGIDCQFCHRTATQGFTAGYPEVQQCMFCHAVVGAGQPEIEKVRQAWASQEPIAWTRLHRMPDHVHFVHEAHIRAGLTCQACHGNVQDMGQVRQVKPLNMGDCLSCHRRMNAPTECATCHY